LPSRCLASRGTTPWKSFDAIAIEIVHQMHRTGNWIVPHIGGDPWIEDPPLFHWVALVFAKALSGFLPLHAAARLASGMFVLGAFWLIHTAGAQLGAGSRAARRGFQRGARPHRIDRPDRACARGRSGPCLRLPQPAQRSPAGRTPSGGRSAPDSGSALRSARRSWRPAR
jgi:hypothetical protein